MLLGLRADFFDKIGSAPIAAQTGMRSPLDCGVQSLADLDVARHL